jgi:hypothetical protein
VTGTVAHRIAQMTPDERARDALELAERVRRRLAEYRMIRPTGKVWIGARRVVSNGEQSGPRIGMQKGL